MVVSRRSSTSFRLRCSLLREQHDPDHVIVNRRCTLILCNKSTFNLTSICTVLHLYFCHLSFLTHCPSHITPDSKPYIASSFHLHLLLRLVRLLGAILRALSTTRIIIRIDGQAQEPYKIPHMPKKHRVSHKRHRVVCQRGRWFREQHRQSRNCRSEENERDDVARSCWHDA
jgi:hypothetical protein